MNCDVAIRRGPGASHFLDRPRQRCSSRKWHLSGIAVFSHERRPCRLAYLVAVDDAWRTREARVNAVSGDDEVDVHVLVDAHRRWRANGAACPAVDGCLDIELGFSPSTHLLQIRRLAWAVAEETALAPREC